MAQYTIGEVEEITGVKSHVLRYWEEVIPSISPQKNIGGRRSYSMRDVQLIMRLRYLIQEKKFTIEGARNCLIEEASLSSKIAESGEPDTAEALAAINVLKSDLINLYTLVRQHRKPSEINEPIEQDSVQSIVDTNLSVDPLFPFPDANIKDVL